MHLINLASGLSYFPTPEKATAAATIALAADVNGKYGPMEGITELRTAIAERYTAEGVVTGAAQILITPGSKMALFNLFSVLLRHGDEVVVPTPFWFGFEELMKYSKGKLVPLPTTLESNYTLTPEALRSTLSDRSRILLLTNPGNPTGRVYTKPELEAILDVAADFPNLYVLSDEIYDFVTYGSPFTSILSCEGTTERTVVVGGISKTFAMAGWRVGYIVGTPDLISRFLDFQASTEGGISPLLQHAALAAIEARAAILPPMLQALDQNRQLVKEKLGLIPQVRYVLPQGAYYFFPDFSYYINSSTPTGEKIATSTDLCRYLKETVALELAPGDKFRAPGHARMSFAVEQEVLEEAMQRLIHALHQLQN
ncbi:pyridoxal phosphate-dependent aminotransferase [Botryobacter ruber]|uniref:pyridoxal phosphate-dependent aminotransferase n=1 Tax=Botryobacter ruber TaxID=2171629 RepID=UPI000E0A1DB0|nr:aminotransferase class I/II-fold pyridoxal phosphate-dependent enzyme [Botryobacter ruber]